ncbi:hypothetical protein TNCV_1307771 [Trichonephila clavipes]|nr:hypothetical protein TNCV_1307771 [Trichonephila clavipes]
MCIYPPSNKVSTIPEDAIANAVFCCDCKLARLRLQGMKTRTLDWNTKPFYLIQAIFSIVTTVSEIRLRILVALPEMHPVPISASLLLQVQFLKGKEEESGIIWQSYGSF